MRGGRAGLLLLVKEGEGLGIGIEEGVEGEEGELKRGGGGAVSA